MKRFFLYWEFALKDVYRLWSATQLQIIIIAGICLPILILLGLKRGHVAKLREELVKSPTGRQVIFWTSNAETFIEDSVVDGLLEEFRTIDLVVPEIQRLVFFTANSGAEQSLEEAITLYSTVPHDPILDQFNAGLSADSAANHIVIAKGFAERHGLSIGHEFSLTLKRRVGDTREAHDVQFLVGGILDTGREGEGSDVGYASIDTMRRLEAYGQGQAVAEWGISAVPDLSATDSYEKLLCICLDQPDSVLSDRDHEYLKDRGLRAIPIETDDLASLFGLIDPAKQRQLRIYTIEQIYDTEGERTTIRDRTSLLSANTEAVDDLFLRWCDPLPIQVNGTPGLAIGISLPKLREPGGWIQSFLVPEAKWFTFENSLKEPLSFLSDRDLGDEIEVAFADRLTLKLHKGAFAVDEEEVTVQGDDTSESNEGETGSNAVPPNVPQVTENTEEPPAESGSKGLQVVVPVTLLSFVEQVQEGSVKFDVASSRFLKIPDPIRFTKARLYASTIDDVPPIVDSLSESGFAVLSEGSRIAEIQDQDRSLQILVLVVAGGVFLFGIVTVFSVLVDSTDRKRTTIGVLRVMGTPQIGIFLLVLFRALIIGSLAALLCAVLGVILEFLLTWDTRDISWLSWKPQIVVEVSGLDLAYIAVGSVACAVLGAIMPAIRASRLDPFDAIMEGRFH